MYILKLTLNQTKVKKTSIILKKGLWCKTIDEDKLNYETSINKLFKERLSPTNNLCHRAFLVPFWNKILNKWKWKKEIKY